MAQKRMTQRERQERARIKKELQAEGLLPPDKKHLNRRKYIQESEDIWNGRPKNLVWEIYLIRAITWAMADLEKSGRSSPQAVAAAKILRIAVVLQQRHDDRRKEGKAVTLWDEAEVVEPILKA